MKYLGLASVVLSGGREAQARQVASRRGVAGRSSAWRGVAPPGAAGLGVGRARQVWAGPGVARLLSPSHVSAWPVMAWQCLASSGSAPLSVVRRGEARHGLTCRGGVRHGSLGLGKAPRCSRSVRPKGATQ